MDDEIFIVRGSTGVDLELTIAGPGSRSYAFVIDWHIRVLLAIAWLAASTLALNGGFKWRPPAGTTGLPAAFIIFLPAAIIYFLYHPIVETLMRGQTPGKRKARVRVVTRDGGIPSVGAILIRNIFRLIDSLPSFYVVGLISTFVSAQRLRIGDMAAGTLLVTYDKDVGRVFSGLNQAATAAGRDFVVTDLAAQLLDRWPALAPEKRSDIARALLIRSGSPERSDGYAAMNDDELKAELMSIAGIKAR